VLLAFDLDKTLVTNDFVLPEDIEQGLRDVREAGHHLTVLTGRPLRAARPFLDQVDLSGPFSVNHGALVMDRGGAVLRRRRIAAAMVDGLVEGYLEDAEVEFSCVVDDTLWVRDPDHERWNWAHTQNRAIDRFRTGLALDADKVVFYANGRSEAVDRDIARSHPELLRYLWGDGFLEIVPTGADKGTALAYIAGRLGVPRDQVVAFGDGLNDLSMLSWAGHSVAVGPEAHPEVIAIAREHIPAPEEGGVRTWLTTNLG
jgi:hypothetical protein